MKSTIQTIQDPTYGSVKLRTVAVLDLGRIFYLLPRDETIDFIHRIHPEETGCGFYQCEAIKTSTQFGEIETHLVIGFVLERDNREWTGEGGTWLEYIKKSGNRRKQKCPICLSESKFQNWIKTLGSVDPDAILELEEN